MNLIKSYFPKLIIVYRGNDVIVKGDDEEILRFESKFHLIIDHYNQFNVLPDDVINQVFLNDSEGISESLDEEKDVLVFVINGIAMRATTPKPGSSVQATHNSCPICSPGPPLTGQTYRPRASAL